MLAQYIISKNRQYLSIRLAVINSMGEMRVFRSTATLKFKIYIRPTFRKKQDGDKVSLSAAIQDR